MKITVSSTSLSFSISSTTVSYMISSYDESFPLFQVLLDFIESYGGIY